MEWQAYEQTYGSLLVHERIDAGFAQVSLILVKAFGGGKRATMRDFMPRWFQDLTADAELARGIAGLQALVNEADDADS
jgi:hypothetical protein